jgi:hypothetical protein
VRSSTVKYIIGKRFDHGGMRWIRECAEALLKLRCIEANGDWERFLDWMHDKLQAEGSANTTNPNLLASKPALLPTLTLVMPGEDDDEQQGDEEQDEEPCASDDEDGCEEEKAA